MVSVVKASMASGFMCSVRGHPSAFVVCEWAVCGNVGRLQQELGCYGLSCQAAAAVFFPRCAAWPVDVGVSSTNSDVMENLTRGNEEGVQVGGGESLAMGLRDGWAVRTPAKGTRSSWRSTSGRLATATAPVEKGMSTMEQGVRAVYMIHSRMQVIKVQLRLHMYLCTHMEPEIWRAVLCSPPRGRICVVPWVAAASSQGLHAAVGCGPLFKCHISCYILVPCFRESPQLSIHFVAGVHVRELR